MTNKCPICRQINIIIEDEKEINEIPDDLYNKLNNNTNCYDNTKKIICAILYLIPMMLTGTFIPYLICESKNKLLCITISIFCGLFFIP